MSQYGFAYRFSSFVLVGILLCALSKMIAFALSKDMWSVRVICFMFFGSAQEKQQGKRRGLPICLPPLLLPPFFTVELPFYTHTHKKTDL